MRRPRLRFLPAMGGNRGETIEEILRKAAKHGKEAHGMKEIPKDLEKKIRSLIREEAA